MSSRAGLDPAARVQWIDLAPLLFVVLWSTGFIAAKAGLHDVGPYHFLLLRFALVSSLLGLTAWLSQAPWPRSPRSIVHIAVAGVLIHAGYLGGVFTALRQGLGAGEVALLVGLQPVLTAAFAARWLGETVGMRRWAGLLLGLVGVTLVLLPRLQGLSGFANAPAGVPAAAVALFAISLGTVYQKRFCATMDLRSGGAIQYACSGLVLAAMISPEDAAPVWSWRLVLALAWLVLVLSVGAVGLLYQLLRRGAASRVASLFYLVPPVTTLMGWAIFDESLHPSTLVGMACVMLALLLIR